MSYLLDADLVISFLNGQRPAIELVNQLAEAGLFLSIIAYGEVYEGLISRRESESYRENLERLVALVNMMSPDVEIAHLYGGIRAGLRVQGLLIPDNGLWIAATALAHDLTLVSRDQHFSRIPGLKVYAFS